MCKVYITIYNIYVLTNKSSHFLCNKQTTETKINATGGEGFQCPWSCSKNTWAFTMWVEPPLEHSVTMDHYRPLRKKMYQMQLFILYNGPWMLLSGCHILAVPSSGRKTVKGSSVRASQMTVTHKLQLHLPVPWGPGINRPELRAKWVCFDYWDVVKLTGQEMILCWKSQFWSHKFGEVNLKAVSASLNLLCESTQLISHGLRQTANNNVVVRQ